MQRAADGARSALDASPDGWLDLPERRKLHAAFGPATPPYEGGPDAGLLRRAALLAAAVRRALPLREQAFPEDRRPHEIVDAALPALCGERPEDPVHDLADALERDVEPLVADPARVRAFLAGDAAVHLTAQAWDGDLEPEFYPPDTRDGDLDTPRVEVMAARAVAGDDLDARRAFWRWYITEAFPPRTRPCDG